MDPETTKLQEKKQNVLENETTPNGDSDSCDEVYSDDDTYDIEAMKKLKESANKGDQFDGEERWEDTPNREHGESMTLQPVEVGEQVAQKHQQETKPQTASNMDQKGGQRVQIKEKASPKRKAYEQRPNLICKAIPYDSRFIYAAYYLLREQLTSFIEPGQGFIKFNPYINTKEIRIYAYDDKKCQQYAQKVDDCINGVQIMEMNKFEAESGVQLSYKYLQYLLKQKITFFKDNTHNYKTPGYYICGKVSKQVLYQKLSEIKKTNFIWIHLFRFENTRSYRAILRKIFETPQVHLFIMEKFKAKEIEVASVKRDFPCPSKDTKRGVLILLTSLGQKKMTIHQQVQQLLSAFIRQTFSVFCFIFQRKKSSFTNKYTPKLDKVTMFFIMQRQSVSKSSYLYIIVKNSDFKEVRDIIIKQVESMNLNITGRRFFKNIYPQREDFGDDSTYRVSSYPRVHTYSWSVQAKKDQKFDWTANFTN